jgi:hypothetical protein
VTSQLLTQKAAARLLGVSTSYLRTSGAPRLFLPGYGQRGHPLLRYDRNALMEWAGGSRSSVQQGAQQGAMPGEESAQTCIGKHDQKSGEKSALALPVRPATEWAGDGTAEGPAGAGVKGLVP